ncbi:hypothetical protein ACOSP7_007645 [Xanthoceras sorbifolium]
MKYSIIKGRKSECGCIITHGRVSVSGNLNAKTNWWSTVQQEIKLDPFNGKLKSTPTPKCGYLLKGEVWIKQGQILLSPNSSLILGVLKDNHCSPIGGHFGFHKILPVFAVILYGL